MLTNYSFDYNQVSGRVNDLQQLLDAEAAFDWLKTRCDRPINLYQMYEMAFRMHEMAFRLSDSPWVDYKQWDSELSTTQLMALLDNAWWENNQEAFEIHFDRVINQGLMPCCESAIVYFRIPFRPSTKVHLRSVFTETERDIIHNVTQKYRPCCPVANQFDVQEIILVLLHIGIEYDQLADFFQGMLAVENAGETYPGLIVKQMFAPGEGLKRVKAIEQASEGLPWSLAFSLNMHLIDDTVE